MFKDGWQGESLCLPGAFELSRASYLGKVRGRVAGLEVIDV